MVIRKLPRSEGKTETEEFSWPRWITWCFACAKRVGWRGEDIGDDHKQFCEECGGRVFGYWRDFPEDHSLYATDDFLKDLAREASNP